MYEYTDKVIAYLNRRYIGMFAKLKGLVSFDELNVMESVNTLQEELDALTKKMFLELALKTYNRTVRNNKHSISGMWLLAILNDYDPITKYVFTHEVDRKRARLLESLIASTTKSKEVDKALRYWSAMITQYALEITDHAALQAYKDDGVTKVQWITMRDERCCEECVARDGKVYDIDKVPPKPHIGCRCRLIPWRGGS